MVEIEAINLVKKFNGVAAVRNISFKIESGEIWGILGPNGAGKSTLLYLLSTLISPNEGDILFKGESIVKKPQAIRPFLGLVPQDIALYGKLSVKDNLEFWGGIYGLKRDLLKSRIQEVLATVTLEDKLNERVETLSGGMKRRLNIAAALVHNPEIIIMDEPTVGIDAESRECILSAVRKLRANGVTIIFTSHYIQEIEILCDKIMIINKGEVIETGTAKQLKQLLLGEGAKEEQFTLEKAYLKLIQKIKN